MNARSEPDRNATAEPATERDPARTWLLTGVTGFIGREILLRALARPQDRVMGRAWLRFRL